MSDSMEVVHRAGWVLKDPWTLVPNGYVVVCDGRVVSVGSGCWRGGGEVVDHGPGVLMPGLVNAHTHLELGALKGRVPYDRGFTRWVAELIRIRGEESEAGLVQGIRDGILELLASGCCAAGEISTLGLSRGLFLDSSLSGVWFHEFLGGDTGGIGDAGGNCSVAGHAPHTTSPGLLRALKGKADGGGMVFAIHVAESLAEDEFIKTGRGGWADFLASRGIDYSGWGVPAESVVSHLDRVGVLDSKTLAVHLIEATAEDFGILAARGVKTCVCVRSNMNLHGKVPDLEGMWKAGLRPSIGTDSLASVSSLSVFDEMAAVAGHYPFARPREIIEMATVRGAEALGAESGIGTLDPGKTGRMVYVSTELKDPDALLEWVVSGDGERRVV